MQQGDPKQVAILSIVALIVVGVAVFRVIPKPGPQTLAQAVRTADSSAPIQKTPERSLVADPFTHPELLKARVETTEQAKAPQAQPKRKTQSRVVPPFGISGSLPGVDSEVSLNPNGEGKTEEIAVIDRKPKVTPQLLLRLVAIMKVEKSLVVFETSGGLVRMYEGQQNGNIRVASIRDNTVVLYLGKSRHTLKIGGSLER